MATARMVVTMALLSCATAFMPRVGLFAVGRRAELVAPRMGTESEVDFGKLDGSDVRIGIISARWNKEIIDNLQGGVRKALKEVGVKDEMIFETQVPGAFELPLAARFLAMSNRVDAIVLIGTLIKGDTMHFEYISDTVSSGVMSVQLQTSVPCIYGVLNVLTEEQAVARSSPENNHGYDWGKSAVEMALLRKAALDMGKKGGGGGLTFGANTTDTGKDSDGKDSDGKPREKVFF